MKTRIVVVLFLFSLLLTIQAKAQTTSVTLQVTDVAAQSWNLGTWAVALQPSPGNNTPANQLRVNGVLVPNITQSGTLSGSGGATMTLTPNGSIAPLSSTWDFTVCPNATAICFDQNVTIVGASQTVTLTPPAPIVFPTPGPPKIAYNDAEISGAVVGSQYYNVTSNTQRICNGPLPCTWADISSGAGGTIGGSIATNQVAVGSATNAIAGSSGFTFNTGTKAFNLGSVGFPSLNSNGTLWFLGFPFGDQINGTSIQLNLTASSPGIIHLSSGISVNSVDFDGATGNLLFNGHTSGVVPIGVASVAGTPNPLLFPTTTGPTGTFISTDGNNPQQSSWDIRLVDSGTSLSYSGTGGVLASAGPVVSGSDGVHAGLSTQLTNTTLPVIVPNAYNTVGPPGATYTAWEDQPASSTSGGPAAHSIKVYPVVGGSPLSSQWFFTTISNCTDTAGQHLNYTQSTDLFSCGTSSNTPTGVVLVPATTAANTIAPTANSVVGLTVLGTTGTGTPDIVDFCTNSAGACGTKEFSVTPAGVATANSQVLGTGSGNCSTPGVATVGNTSAGIDANGGVLILCSGGVQIAIAASGVFSMRPTTPLGFLSPGFSFDTAFSREAAGVVDIGNGTQGDVTGTIKPGSYATGTNCSSSASPAVCGSAAAGNAALPTNAVSSSIQINTSAVTANSQIFVMSDDTLGTKLGVTCNSTIATLVGGLTISGRNAGVSFTVANNVAVVTNPLCISYHIIN